MAEGRLQNENARGLRDFVHETEDQRRGYISMIVGSELVQRLKHHAAKYFRNLVRFSRQMSQSEIFRGKANITKYEEHSSNRLVCPKWIVAQYRRVISFVRKSFSTVTLRAFHNFGCT